ncbi:uncharacterized protein DMAD_10684 [Drosophila madeirensis]|uniref:Mitotic-spindle organizing protein 1 n=1 Tax=Drosophila madeirensis TaxID=30013 RepID=A0AAU9FAF4_DROMD
MSQAAPEQAAEPAMEPRQRVKDSTHLKRALNGMSALMQTNLSEPALDLCLELLEDWVSPKALANIVLRAQEIKRTMNKA